MDSILHMLNVVQDKIRDNVGSSSPSASEPVPFQPPVQINDHIYEVCNPGGRPSIEIVFFHGLQFEDLSSGNAHVTTWFSRDKSELWLRWLLKPFPRARILTISYDPWMTDMYGTRENLVHSFTGKEAQIGQDGCPVVLVGHSLGGLVMKELCVQANHILSLNRRDEPNEAVENLLERVKGLFFYACPHHGSKLAESNVEFRKAPLFQDWTPIDNVTERRNEDFRKLRTKHGWKTFGIGETNEISLGGFKGLVVPEESARHDVDEFSTLAANHFEVCRPIDPHSNSFLLLSNFVADVLRKDEWTEARLLEGREIVGLEDSVKIVQEKLRGAQHLAIVGMGGKGKTTLAMAVFDEISRKFDYTCYFDKVKEHMDNVENPKKLKENIMRRLKDRDREVSSSFKWRMLKGKSVLIVLDDVELPSQVLVLTDSDGLSLESRVIVTSREMGFLKDFDFYMMKGLNLEDSKMLFCLHAFKERIAPRAFQERVTRFAKKCVGFPLALMVSGRFLYKQGQPKWDAAFESLSQAEPLNGKVEDGLWSVLRVSYNSLAPREQQMFLDAATCFYGEKLTKVQTAWRGCYGASEKLVWQNLVDRFLVTDIYREECISMHEVLRDLGRKIAGHSRVTVNFDLVDLDLADSLDITIDKAYQLQRGQHTLQEEQKARIKVLKLSLWGFYSDFGDLSRFKDLEILWLDGILPNDHMHHFPPNLVSLMVKWDPNGDPATRSGALQNLLEVQSLRSVALWSYDVDLPQADILCLPSQLEYLDIDEWGLISLLEVGHMRKLRHISLARCRDLQKLPDSFVHLRTLEHLEISDCESLTALPEEFGDLTGLRHLSLNGCHSLQKLPDSFVRLCALEHFEIECESLRELPKEFGDLKGLCHLSLNMCHSLQKLPDSFVRLCALEQLEIYSVSLRELPKEFGDLKGLCHLSLIWCNYLQKLPDSFVRLCKLEHLEIESTSLRELPKEFGDLTGLRHLSLNECRFLKILPDSFVRLCALEHLKIHSVSLRELPNEFGDLKGLCYLSVRECDYLQKLPDSFVRLCALEHLKISYCESLKALPEKIVELDGLRYLSVTNCDSLEELHPSFVHLGAFKT